MPQPLHQPADIPSDADAYSAAEPDDNDVIPVRRRKRKRNKNLASAPWATEDDSLSFEVNLVSKDDIDHTSKSETTPKDHVQGDIKSLNINTSHCYSDSAGVDMVVLTEDSEEHSYMRWIHIQQSQMTLKNLRAYIRQNGHLHRDDIVLADRLLDKVCERGEKPLASQGILRPMVLQSRSRRTEGELEPTRYCTFTNFPYLILRPKFPTSSPSSTTRGLVQTLYTSASPKVWDEKQVICEVQQKRQESTRVLQVTQLWTMSFSSGTIITMSIDPRNTLLGKTIRISQPSKSNRTGPSMVRVTDPLGRLFFFSIEQCQTWFELMYLMERNFLRDMHYTSAHCEFFLPKDREIESSQWVDIIADVTSPFVELEVRIRADKRRLDKRTVLQHNGQITNDSLVINDIKQIVKVPKIYSHGQVNDDAGPSRPRAPSEKIPSRAASISSGLFSTRFSYLPVLMWPTADLNEEDQDKQLEPNSDGELARSKIAQGKMPEGSESPGHNSMDQILARINESFSEDLENVMEDIYFETPESSFSEVMSLLDLMNAEAEQLRNLQVPQGAPTAILESENTILLDIINNVDDILRVFIPISSSSIVTRKCYGAIKQIVQVARQTYNSYYGAKSFGFRSDLTICTIQDRSYDEEYLTNHDLPLPAIGILDCERCLTGIPYKTTLEATDHLHSAHFLEGARPSQEDLNRWISRVVLATGQARCSDIRTSLSTCADSLKDILKMVTELRDGVHMDGSHKRMRCQLPNSLVDAFQDIMKFCICTGHAFVLGDTSAVPFRGTYGSIAASPGNTRTAYNMTAREMARRAYGNVTQSIQSAKHDLLMMLRTQDFSSSVRYQAVGPDYIMATIIRNLQTGVDCTWKELLRLYDEYSEILSFKIELAPRRRVFRDLNRMNKELKAIFEIVQQQRKLLYNLEAVLDPSSFRITSRSRLHLFPLEIRLMRSGVGLSDDTSMKIIDLQRDSRELEFQAKLGVEIINDDNGKAIFIFTVVTLIFLPLSFVTSFLGMNTVDIRDQNTSQWVFWAISLPLTGGIIAMTLLLAFRYDSMRDWFEEWKSKRLRHTK